MSLSSTNDEATAADTRPAVERGVEFDKCLVFTLRAEWGHFKRNEANVVKPTYRLMPRSTVAGLCAAICGWSRDSYYDEFAPESSAMAIEPIADLRTLNIPVNTLSTESGALKGNHGHHTWPIPSIKLVDPTKKRQQHNYEVLVDPAYRVYVWLSGDLYEELRSHLEAGTNVYTTSLGLSEYLASVTYEGERSVRHALGQEVEEATVQSAVPSGPTYVAPTPGVQTVTERSAGFMERLSDKPHARRTTGSIEWTLSPTADALSVTDDAPVSEVEGIGRVVFA